MSSEDPGTTEDTEKTESSKTTNADTSPVHADSSPVHADTSPVNHADSSISENQFHILCDQFQSCLDTLWEQKMTEVFGTASQVFRMFRGLFSGNRKLKNKVFQLMSEQVVAQQLRSSDVNELMEHLKMKDEKIRALEESLFMTKDYQQRDKELLERELKKLKFMRIEDLYTEEERMNIRDRIDNASEQISLLQQDLSHSKEREETYWRRTLLQKKELEELSGELEEVKGRLEVSEHRCRLTDNALQKKTEVVQEDRELKEALKAEIQTLKGEAKKAEEKIESMSKELQFFHSVHKEDPSAALRKNLVARKFHILHLETELKKFKEALAKEKQDTHSLNMEVRKCHITIHHNTQKINNLENKLKELNEDNEMYKTNEKRLQRELNVLLNKRTDEDLIAYFEKRIDNLNFELKNSKTHLHNCIIESQDRESKNLLYQRELVAKEDAVKELHTSLMQLKHEKRHQVCLVESLTKSGEALQKDLHEQKEKYLDKEAECTRLQQDLLQERNTAHLYQKAEYDVRVQMEGMQQKLSEVARLRWAVDSDTKQRNEKIKHLNGEVTRLKKQIDHLQITTRGASIKLKKNEKLMARLKETLVNKERHLVKAFRQGEERSRELESIRERTLNLVNAKRAAHMKISALASEVDVKGRKILSLEEEITRMQGEATKKQEEVEMLSQELRTLKNSLLEMKQPHAMGLYVREINNLKRLLDQEKLKNIALGNEILKPKVRKKFNSFENSKSHLETLLSKNSCLQKELARKAETLRKLENDLLAKTAEAETLRSEVNQRIETVRDEKLWSVQKDLESSRSRIKTLLGERNASESLCSKYEKEIDRLKQELKEFKSQ